MTAAAFIDCYVSGIIYLGVRSYGFACRVGSIRTVVDEEGKEVFEAKYDAWGVQEVNPNIGWIGCSLGRRLGGSAVNYLYVK